MNGPRTTWTARLKESIPGFMAAHAELAPVASRATVLLHGSTTMGIDDAHSDLDLWLLPAEDDLAELDASAGTRFFEFTLDGKAGHLNAESVERFAAKMRGCHMDTVYQLRGAAPILDPAGIGAGLMAEAGQPMRAEVAEALFFYHYVEFRGEHRACDTPVERGNSLGLLLALPKALAQAMRAALVLQREPYPYDKWLWHVAGRTPVGARMAPHVEVILDCLAEDGLRLQCDEHDHPVINALRDMRHVLIEEAQARGIDEPWLHQWWLHMDAAAAALEEVVW